MADDYQATLSRIRAALGHKSTLDKPPIPPTIDEPITRRVHFDIGLPELFAQTAKAAKIQLTLARPEELIDELAKFLQESQVRRVAVAVSPLLDRLAICQTLKARGFDARRWDEMTLDELYDFDCGITDVYRAVAETGSIVIRSSPGNGRSLSLVPPIHVAIVEPKNLVPDLVDLFQTLTDDRASAGSVHLITGPSKTADIEMNLVVGVHGPGKVRVFLLN